MTLLAAYNFDEASGNVLDVTGNGHDFAINGGLQRVTTGGADPTGYAGKGLGTTDGFADLGPSVFGQTAQRTLCFWLRSTADFSPGWIWEWHNTAGDTGRWGMLALTGAQGFRGTNSSTTAHASRAAVGDSTWHFWAGTYDGTNVRLYYGTTLGSLALTDTKALSSPLRTDADVIRIFATAETGNIVRHVRIYDEVLDLTALNTVMAQPVSAVAPPTDVVGSGSVVLPGVAAAAAGRRLTAGSGTASLPGVVAASTGQRAVSGTGSASLPRVMATTTGERAARGSGSVTLPPLVAHATGGGQSPPQDVTGAGAASLGPLTATATGTVAAPPQAVTGTGTASLGGLTAVATSVAPNTGQWLTADDFASMRADQDAMMYDRVSIRHPGMVEGEFDPDLGYAPGTPHPAHYVGRARVQSRYVQSGQTVPAGLGTLTTMGYAVAVPYDVISVAPNDIVTVLSSIDPRAAGRQLVITDVQQSTYVTARRMTATEYQPPEGS